MKKIKAFFLLTAVLLLLPAFASCSGGGPGAGSSAPDAGSSEQSEAISEASNEPWEVAPVFTCGKEKYDVAGVNAVPDGDGVWYFDREFGSAAPSQSGDYTDVAVVGGTVAMIFDNEPAIIPESGFAVRFSGVAPAEAPSLGDTARFSAKSPVYTPECYVRFGDVTIEVGYHNVVRIDEDTGFIFDSGWYNSRTCSNIYGTEIAVGADGTVVEINPSGSETSGNTYIPRGGCVLAVGQGSTCESRLKKVAVGDRAEYVREEHLYTVKKFVADDKNRDGARMSDGIVFYSSGYTATPSGSGTDIIVGSDGVITAIIPNTSGGNAIPSGGFAVCGTGKYSSKTANAAQVGDICLIDGIKTLVFIKNPATVRARLLARLEQARIDRAVAFDDLAYIDFKAVDEAYNNAKKLLEDGKTGAELASSLISAREQLDICETELIPSVTVGDRAAWVTIGERDYNQKPYLHYTDKESVERTVAYAKSLNLNTLIIDGVASGYTVYPSGVPGLIETDLAGGLDLVQAFSDACEANGIRLIVLICALMSSDQSVTYPEEDHYMNLYRDCLLKSKTGKTADGYGAVALDPSQPRVRQFIIDAVTELATNYPKLYGIQIDYIRYPLPIYYQKENYDDFGYDCPASEAFRARYGADPKTLSIDDPLWENWRAARREVVTSLASGISSAVRSVNPKLNVSFTCFPDAEDRRKYVLQEPEKWAESGIADAIYPMIYSDKTANQLSYAEQIAPAGENADILLGVGAFVRASERSLAEQLVMPFELGYAGTAVFTLRYISTCGYNDVVKKAFREYASPSGASAEMPIEACALRAERLMYLFPEETALSVYASRLRNTTMFYNSLALTAFDGLEFNNPRLRETLYREAEYFCKLSSDETVFVDYD